jgi:hypothetical protein
VKIALDSGEQDPVLIYDDATAARIEVDFRGSPEDVVRRLSVEAPGPMPAAPRGPGRPRLGVVAREVTLLPRHWQWLNAQPGGASVALRKLVEAARRANADRDQIRESQEAAYRFLTVIAGDWPGFEEAARALFAGDAPRFEMCTAAWPRDVRDYAGRLAANAFRAQPAA